MLARYGLHGDNALAAFVVIIFQSTVWSLFGPAWTSAMLHISRKISISPLVVVTS